MKTKLLFGLALLATLGMTSCKKDKEEEPTSIKIGNKDYAIAKIGDQTWTTENYSGEGGEYYNNDATNASFGKLYSIEEVNALTAPQGWHVATYQDYKKLFEGQGVSFEMEGNIGFSTENSAAAVKKLMSTTGWTQQQGTNTSSFNAMPGGEKYEEDFGRKGNIAVFWTSSKDSDQAPYYFGIFYDSEQPYAYFEPFTDTNKFSVRFVKNN